MHLRPEEAESHGYRPLLLLRHDQLIPFVSRQIRTPGWFSGLYWAINLVFLLLSILWLFRPPVSGQFGLRFGALSFGLALALLLIPLHEWIHILAYKAMGARQTRLKADWRRFAFLALADGFVAGKRPFRWIALSPFLVITLSLLGLFLVLPHPHNGMALSACLFHTACCSGDFALLQFMEQPGDIITWDETHLGQTHFWIRREPSSESGS